MAPALILDDIAARGQIEFGFARNLQASSVEGAGFAIRCGGARGYEHKCRAILPSINDLISIWVPGFGTP